MHSNFSWGLEQVIGIGVLVRATVEWPVSLLIGVALAPESPWETAFHADETLAMMRYTTILEEKLTRGATYWDWFKGTDLRHRTTGSGPPQLLHSGEKAVRPSPAPTPPIPCSKPGSPRASPTSSRSANTPGGVFVPLQADGPGDFVFTTYDGVWIEFRRRPDIGAGGDTGYGRRYTRARWARNVVDILCSALTPQISTRVGQRGFLLRGYVVYPNFRVPAISCLLAAFCFRLSPSACASLRANLKIGGHCLDLGYEGFYAIIWSLDTLRLQDNNKANDYFLTITKRENYCHIPPRRYIPAVTLKPYAGNSECTDQVWQRRVELSKDASRWREIHCFTQSTFIIILRGWKLCKFDSLRISEVTDGDAFILTDCAYEVRKLIFQVHFYSSAIPNSIDCSTPSPRPPGCCIILGSHYNDQAWPQYDFFVLHHVDFESETRSISLTISFVNSARGHWITIRGSQIVSKTSSSKSTWIDCAFNQAELVVYIPTLLVYFFSGRSIAGIVGTHLFISAPYLFGPYVLTTFAELNTPQIPGFDAQSLYIFTVYVLRRPLARSPRISVKTQNALLSLVWPPTCRRVKDSASVSTTSRSSLPPYDRDDATAASSARLGHTGDAPAQKGCSCAPVAQSWFTLGYDVGLLGDLRLLRCGQYHRQRSGGSYAVPVPWQAEPSNSFTSYTTLSNKPGSPRTTSRSANAGSTWRASWRTASGDTRYTSMGRFWGAGAGTA
ncbi:hypothetical protein C8J57DRAFT_1239397 [Mycena rebaudengoi]|nr:hypothetical protein C8J57DRAFT_1239397 [Mycena rebaudengoi]